MWKFSLIRQVKIFAEYLVRIDEMCLIMILTAWLWIVFEYILHRHCMQGVRLQYWYSAVFWPHNSQPTQYRIWWPEMQNKNLHTDKLRVQAVMLHSVLNLLSGHLCEYMGWPIFVQNLERNQDLVLKHVYLSVHNDLILRPFVSAILSILRLTLNFMFLTMGH